MFCYYFCWFFIFTILEGIAAKNVMRIYEKAGMPYSTAKIFMGMNEDQKFEHFMMPTSKKIEIKKLESCGSKMHPHGIFIDSRTNRPMMYCEPHQCFKPEHLDCQRNVLPSACNSSNQWIAGIHQNHMNASATFNLFTVDCCQYRGISSGKFVKHLKLSSKNEFVHEIVVKEGRLIQFEYVNNLKIDKIENDNSKVFDVEVYQMSCPIEPWQLKSIDSFVKKEMIGPPPKNKEILVYQHNALDRNSSNLNRPTKDIWNPYSGPTSNVPQVDLKLGENPALIINSCGRFGFPHGFFIDMITSIPRMYCVSWPSCFQDPNKILCTRENGVTGCKNENEWIAGYIPRKGSLDIECCHYEDIHSGIFVKHLPLNLLDIFTHDVYRKTDHAMIGFTYVNDLPLDKTGKAMYNASVYRMKCPRVSDEEFNALLNAP